FVDFEDLLRVDDAVRERSGIGQRRLGQRDLARGGAGVLGGFLEELGAVDGVAVGLADRIGELLGALIGPRRLPAARLVEAFGCWIGDEALKLLGGDLVGADGSGGVRGGFGIVVAARDGEARRNQGAIRYSTQQHSNAPDPGYIAARTSP